jgi:holo-[acyl-carrier protein] synthase
MIKGIGIDIVDVARFKAAMDRWGERLCSRLFTEAELGYCLGRRKAENHLAARFAAKESLKKALGRSLNYQDVEVTRDSSGRPAFKVVGLDEGTACVLTMSHDGGLAVAETVVIDEVS